MSTVLEQLQYGFDRNSRRTWQRRSLTDTQDQHYAYDSLGQVSAAARGSLNVNLTAISGRPASAQGWDYDPTGNWRGYHAAANGTTTLDQHRVHDRGNRLTQIEGNPSNMILDRVGRMRQMAPDAGGDWEGKLEITWDAWSRITSVKNNGEVVGDYAYDGRHRRITREVDGETLRSYYNDAWRPVEERKDAEMTASISYLWGARHRDDLVRRDRAVDGSTLNETRYVLMDYFNPAAITDEAGEVKERYAFSAFGLRTILNPDFTVRSSSECGMEFAFQGQFIDAESGLINYGYRYYSPHLGRWTCKDPIEEKGGLNLYEFTENDPVNNVDKLGLVCGVVVARSKEFPGHQMIGGVGPANPNAKDLIPSRDYTSTSGNWAILNPEEGKWGTCSLPRKNDYSFYFYYLVAFKSDGCFASGVAKGLTCKDNLNCPKIKSCLDTYTAPGTLGTFEGTGTLGDNCRTASESALNACCVSMSDCVNCPVATGETTWPMYGN